MSDIKKVCITLFNEYRQYEYISLLACDTSVLITVLICILPDIVRSVICILYVYMYIALCDIYAMTKINKFDHSHKHGLQYSLLATCVIHILITTKKWNNISWIQPKCV